MFQFLLGFLCGLMPFIGFVLGFRARTNYETTRTITGKVKMHEPVYRTDEQERDLENMTDAEAEF